MVGGKNVTGQKLKYLINEVYEKWRGGGGIIHYCSQLRHG
jgi:hypothetical protein